MAQRVTHLAIATASGKGEGSQRIRCKRTRQIPEIPQRITRHIRSSRARHLLVESPRQPPARRLFSPLGTFRSVLISSKLSPVRLTVEPAEPPPQLIPRSA